MDSDYGFRHGSDLFPKMNINTSDKRVSLNTHNRLYKKENDFKRFSHEIIGNKNSDLKKFG